MSAELLHESRDDDRRRRALWLWFAIIAVLIAGLIVAIQRLNGCSGNACGADASSQHTGGPPAAGAGGTSRVVKATTHTKAAASTVSIKVAGSSPSALAPGVTSPVTVTVTNTGTATAHVTTAGIDVADASGGCTAAGSIRTTSYDATAPNARQYEIAPGHSARIALRISMLDLTSNQNACKNARFPLTFVATAQQG